jgi:phage shock protein A
MITALKGGVNEAGEAIVDSQALRILDQEVREASEALQQSKNSLAEIMARQKVAQERCGQLKTRIEEHEGYALKALEKGDEGLAHEVAERIADLENQRVQEAESADAFAVQAGRMRLAIQQTERNLKRLKQQVDTVKANESVQRAQAAVAERHSGSHSKMRTAMDSLERIKEKQALKTAQMEAASELAEQTSDVSLQAKLEAAGIAPGGSSANDILERLKTRAVRK